MLPEVAFSFSAIHYPFNQTPILSSHTEITCVAVINCFKCGLKAPAVD